MESGEILGKIRADRGFTPDKLRDLHFDVLIALTARAHGARLITSNRADFEMINSYRKSSSRYGSAIRTKNISVSPSEPLIHHKHL
jgi:predicted nucleic acid-binding protein